ncbi:2OG-Fe(II) oxygenase [Iodobacter sp.]|uniref:2OG-Fe(II) oxygenase n=1 Tax=Iodobacter sp. TaxID=1915058 RepID=UPI0025FAD68D|nr:2OG-Fe(II) oxygenase [Iodobacter sp.]
MKQRAMGIEFIIDGLVKNGFAVLPQFLKPHEVNALAQVMRERKNLFHQAGIGRNAGHAVLEQIRGDEICWIEPTDPLAATALAQLAELKYALNSQLYLGLDELECHFAIYPVGSFYKRHLDQHRGEDTRVVTIVLYLNPAWQAHDGGELRLYLGEEQYMDIAPVGGSLVVFLSNQFEHEVLVSKRERLSLTGWFRRRLI